MNVAEHMTRLCDELRIPYVFKSSFDKANRTSVESWRGPGVEGGMRVLQKIRKEFGVPVLTDVHEPYQAAAIGGAVDVLQVPAFLCRQTDLLVACGQYGAAVNVKKGQFLPPEDMKYAIDKVRSTGNANITLTERGSSFGYRDLIVDMRSLVTMRSLGYPVVFDATHSVQQMGGLGGSSGGRTEFIPAQIRGAVAVGVDALFMETHPAPETALSDGSTMVPLHMMRDMLQMALEVHAIHHA